MNRLNELRRQNKVFVIGDRVKITKNTHKSWYSDEYNTYYDRYYLSKVGKITNKFYIGELVQYEITFEKPFLDNNSQLIRCCYIQEGDFDYE